MKSFNVEVVSCGGSSCGTERMILVVVPAGTSSSFGNWKSANSNLSWTNELPEVYSGLASGNSNPEPSNCDPQHWENTVDNDVDHYHPGSTYDFRSEKTTGNHGHQARYYSNGNLVSGGLAGGTADRGHYTVLIGGNSHRIQDVLPFIHAAQLDANPVKGTTTFANLTHPLMYKGSNLNKYLQYRLPLTSPSNSANTCLD